jgi:hypothetical protein
VPLARQAIVILRELRGQSYLPLDFRFTRLVRDRAAAQYDAKGHELTCAAFFDHLIGASEQRRYCVNSSYFHS